MSVPFHHRGISRMKAEDMLTKVGEQGCFLIRDSETVPGAYVLCLLCEGIVHQYRILPTQDHKIAVQCEGSKNGPKFPNLQILVQEYIQRGDHNGLICALKKPVSSENADEAEKDTDDDMDDDEVSATASSNHLPSIATKSSLMENFSCIDLSCFDGAFVDGLSDYMESGLYRDAQLERNNSASHLLNLRELLKPSTASLTSELTNFMQRINACTKVFSGNEINRDSHVVTMDGSSNFNTLAMKLLVCATKLKDLQHMAQGVLKTIELDQGAAGSDLGFRKWGDASLRGTLNIPQATFEVKSVKHGRIIGSVSVTVDIQSGKLVIVKPSKDVLDESNTFTHEKILQLVKSTKDKKRLDIFIKGRKKQTLQFEDIHVRENFCQQILQLKTMHSTSTETDQISIFIGTWNMGNAPPPWNLKAWLLGEGLGKTRSEVFDVIPHDLYIIGTQESSLTEKDWANTIRSSIKECFSIDMHIVEVSNLWGIRLMVLTKPEHVHRISHIQHSSVRTGIANKLGNKGAVAISFHFNGTSFCFINSHLASGNERSARRGQNYRDIIKGLNMGSKDWSIIDATHQFHHVFWFGDLNYRVNGDIQVTLAEAKQGNVIALLERDQLLNIRDRKEAFVGFAEEQITFMPTYRLRRGIEVLDYDWKKIKKTSERINSPSWCDRVLWLSYPGTYIENTSYGCAYKILTSDHRPVFSSFNVGIMSQFVSPGRELAANENSTAEIIFETVHTEIKTFCSQYFYLEFYSTCLKEVISSRSNKQFKSSESRCTPLWTSNLLPKNMVPVFTDQEYLEDQHIIIAVRTRDGDNESYGEGVVSLKGTFTAEPVHFSTILSHHGEETGFMVGKMHVFTEEAVKPKTSFKSYELVMIDTDPSIRNVEGIESSPPEIDDIRVTKSAPVPTSSEPTSTKVDENERNDNSLDVDEDEAGDLSNIGARFRPKLLMGQSSLIQNQVLPIVSTTVSVPSKPMTETVSSASFNQPPTVTTSVGAPLGPPVPSRWPDEGVDPAKQPAPPVPKRSIPKPSVEEAIVISNRRLIGMKRPKTVEEWLQELGLPEYIPLFLCNGWDSMEFLCDLSNSDLDSMFIRDEKQREKIMESLKILHIK